MGIKMPTPNETVVPGWLARWAAVSWRLAVIGVVLYGLDRVLREFSSVILPFIIATFVASILNPVVTRLTERGFPRWVGASVTVVGACLIVFGSMALVTGTMVSKAAEFSNQVRAGWGKLSRGIAHSLPGVHASDIRTYITDLVNQSGGHFESATASISSGASVVTNSLVGIALVVVFAFFFLKDGPDLIDRALQPLDERRQVVARRVLTATWTTVSAYMQGLTIVATAIALMVGIAMLLIGVPMIIPVVVLSFFGSYVPFAGSFIATSVAGLIALASGGPTDAILMVGSCLLVQFIEGNFLQPVVFGRAVELHPVVVLAAVTAGATVWGVAGAFLAVPIVATFFAASTELNRARFELEAEPPPAAPSPESEKPLIETP